MTDSNNTRDLIETTMTPKQRVIAMYPSAHAVNLRTEDPVTKDSWVIRDNPNAHPDHQILGSNGSASGAWANAAKAVDAYQLEAQRDNIRDKQNTFMAYAINRAMAKADEIDPDKLQTGDVVTYRDATGKVIAEVTVQPGETSHDVANNMAAEMTKQGVQGVTIKNGIINAPVDLAGNVTIGIDPSAPNGDKAMMTIIQDGKVLHIGEITDLKATAAGNASSGAAKRLMLQQPGYNPTLAAAQFKSIYAGTFNSRIEASRGPIGYSVPTIKTLKKRHAQKINPPSVKIAKVCMPVEYAQSLQPGGYGKPRRVGAKKYRSLHTSARRQAAQLSGSGMALRLKAQ